MIHYLKTKTSKGTGLCFRFFSRHFCFFMPQRTNERQNQTKFRVKKKINASFLVGSIVTFIQIGDSKTTIYVQKCDKCSKNLNMKGAPLKSSGRLTSGHRLQ